MPPNPRDYILEKGFLKNIDGSEVIQIPQISSSACSICLMTQQEAIPWLREGRKISPDELAIFIIGGEDDSNIALETQVLQLPCRDGNDRQVILAGLLVQLGEKTLQRVDDTSKGVKLDPTQIVALTAWKADWSDEEWAKIVKHNFASFRVFLGRDHPECQVHTMWGRSLKGPQGTADDRTATSVQVHCTVAVSSLRQLLSKSGFSKIFATPKGESGRHSDEYRVLWVPGDIAHVTAVASGTQNCQGLIRGKNTLGLRFAKGDFAAAWKILHPDEEPPAHTGGALTFRLEPLPFGCNHKVVEAWANQYSWTIKAVKAVGAKAWLITSDNPPPEGVLLFNNNPIIARSIAPRMSQQSNPVIAGPKPRKSASSSTDHRNSLGPLEEDPWARYQPLAKGALTAAPARTTDGPIETKFKQQTTRMDAFEQSLKTFTEQQQHMQSAAAKGLKKSKNEILKPVRLFNPVLNKPRSVCNQ